jgi:secreted trypsin-like serine protease
MFVPDALGRAYSNLATNDFQIVGGDKIPIEDAPYQVFLLVTVDDKRYACGGSIISSRAILTAAHCIAGYVSFALP